MQLEGGVGKASAAKMPLSAIKTIFHGPLLKDLQFWFEILYV